MCATKLTAMLIVAAMMMQTASAEETKILPSVSSLAQSFFQRPSSNPPSPPTNASVVQQFPFQLLSGPQLGNLVALFNNITQTLNRPQSGQQIQAIGTPLEPRVLHPEGPVSSNNIYTTLPFNDLNITEFSWLWDSLLANGTSLKPNEKPGQEGMRPKPKFFGGGNTTFADLNFLTVPQLLNLFGR